MPQTGAAQHAPSTQLPESHSVAPVQAAPVGFLPQLPLTQNRPATQSMSVVQMVLHTLPAESQTNVPQLCVCAAGQVPFPSQVVSLLSVEDPAGHEAARHTVLGPHLRQAPMPLQVPSLPHVLCACAAQPPAGSI